MDAATGPRSKVQKPPKKQRTKRLTAVGQGLVPKARKAFALFLMENASVGKGAARTDFIADMKRVGKLWEALSAQDKEVYNERSRKEFQAQRTAMTQAGIHVPNKLPSNQPCQLPSMMDDCPKKYRIGPYTIRDHGSQDDVLGGGSYGKVFSSFAADGRSCAIKVFRKRDGKDDAAHEVALCQRLGQMEAMHLRWFPQLLDFDVHGQPFPWMALSHAGASLETWLNANGPLAGEMVKACALQLEAAIRT